LSLEHFLTKRLYATKIIVLAKLDKLDITLPEGSGG